MNQARLIIKKTIEHACGRGMKGVNFEFLKEDVRDEVGKFLFQENPETTDGDSGVVGVSAHKTE
ncbi:MAG: hypothetical protein A3D65_02740 [Candidatus Lloydbacteria bacterium RIFCSPHIGHO2_02_FULL_50_13]|uniref:Uncharacterized protein n=1 Tax=Candidatus Lloydbacteria bacterium RIFCSPHIGHO2_02_FULL_50_13 TaxID=1798661 RepID=A0A1G2D3L8_9BACT|nr:MAG: hypothetical protein A3D65_02740 [Candidatus Lloydbacteria bacterium RIFCSPHIGHO2_02_FULL_50_13]